jgi:FkbM family methyltransferase
MGIKALVKERVRRLVGTHELNLRQQSFEISLERLSAAYEDSRPELVGTLENPSDQRQPSLERAYTPAWLRRQSSGLTSDQRQSSLQRAYTVAIGNTVRQASEEAFFRTNLNDVEVDLPRDTIRMYVECLQGSPEGPLNLYLETAHLKWMMSHVVRGGTFLDVGSSVGTMTVVMATEFGAEIKIAAFEPARQARRLLKRTLERNRLVGVEVLPNAVSNTPGIVAFSEYSYDETCDTPWLPDASAIHSQLIDDSRAVRYDVETITLDAFCSARGLLNSPTVVKIDVEGFEVQVLEGSLALIAGARPWFSIDIHKDPFGDGTTEVKVRALLGRHGYNFETMGHVLLASP